MKTTLILSASMIAAALALPANAQDDSLYPDPSAPDASFLRVILPDGATATVDGTAVEAPEAGVTAYAEVSPGEVEIAVDDTTQTVEVGANTHYTWTAAAAEPALVTDMVEDSPAQADLLMYNLSEADPVTLYAVEGETAALEGVETGTHDGVGLKAPLTLTFEIRQDGETLTSLDPVDLRRGAATTIVVTGPADAPEAAATDRVYQ
ncbi:alginate O-acetyltransferase AlgF [Salipiger mucosus]|uniref:Alginate biosynthesis protein AlgF n=1 Tax=Salipiger mucosus DSM 16094 TaxID=1123237 RepID=S9QXB2_9RHOB|nr:alginate O-acetyltransferase AlgF [Salipiger mucosus]EPX86006.1 hypothetical protein Salmuc_00822 [Salipiger mucosus DSM 16094]